VIFIFERLHCSTFTQKIALVSLICNATPAWIFILFVFFFTRKFRLCVVGLASAHVALKEEGGVTAIDFNVGKTDRSEIKVTGKRKRVKGLIDTCSLFD
jgi:hypothetical protein